MDLERGSYAAHNREPCAFRVNMLVESDDMQVVQEKVKPKLSSEEARKAAEDLLRKAKEKREVRSQCVPCLKLPRASPHLAPGEVGEGWGLLVCLSTLSSFFVASS